MMAQYSSLILLLVKYLLVTPLAALFVAEKSGVVESIKWRLFYRVYTRKTRYRPFRLKPFDCAMCLTFWFVLAQLFIPFDCMYYLIPFAAASLASIFSRF